MSGERWKDWVPFASNLGEATWTRFPFGVGDPSQLRVEDGNGVRDRCEVGSKGRRRAYRSFPSIPFLLDQRALPFVRPSRSQS
jgi:hypothetical protein